MPARNASHSDAGGRSSEVGARGERLVMGKRNWIVECLLDSWLGVGYDSNNEVSINNCLKL